MPSTFQVVAAKHAGEKPNPHGGTLQKFYCSFKDSEGKVHEDVYWQRKSAETPEGEVYGRIEQGEYGPRFYTEQRQNGGGGAQTRSEDLSPEFWAQKDRRIARAGVLQAVVTSGAFNSELGGPGNYVSAINEVVDALLASLDERTPSPNSDSVAAPPPRTTENAGEGRDTPASGFASDKQKDFFTRLLKEAGGKPETVNAIVLYAESALDKRLVSEAIEGLKEEASRRGTALSLAKDANEWAARQPSDIPADMSGYDEPMADDPSVPF